MSTVEKIRRLEAVALAAEKVLNTYGRARTRALRDLREALARLNAEAPDA